MIGRLWSRWAILLRNRRMLPGGRNPPRACLQQLPRLFDLLIIFLLLRLVSLLLLVIESYDGIGISRIPLLKLQTVFGLLEIGKPARYDDL